MKSAITNVVVSGVAIAAICLALCGRANAETAAQSATYNINVNGNPAQLQQVQTQFGVSFTSNLSFNSDVNQEQPAVTIVSETYTVSATGGASIVDASASGFTATDMGGTFSLTSSSSMLDGNDTIQVTAAAVSVGPAGITVGGTVVFSDGSSVEAFAAFNFNVVELDVNSVPQYLFASAQYATPVKFTLNGTDKAYIQGIRVRLTDDGSGATVMADVSERFAAGDTADQSNGTTNCYTAFVPASTYSGMSVPGDKTTQARFGVSLLVSKTASDTPLNITNLVGDPNVTPVIYCDGDIPAFDMAPATYSNPQSVQYSADVSTAGQGSFQHWRDDNSIPGHTVVPHEDPDAHLPGTVEGFLDCTQGNSVLNGGSDAEPGVYLYTRLMNESTTTRMGGEGFKNRVYGRRLSGYFYISYGGRAVNVLPSGELAMDLTKQNGSFQLTMLPTGYASITNNLINPGGGNTVGVLATAFLVANSIYPGTTALNVAITSARVFMLVDAADLDSGAALVDTAEGTIYRVVMRSKYNGGTSASTWDPIDYSENGTMNFPGVTMQQNFNCSIADQFVVFMEFECLSSSVAHAWYYYGGSGDVNCSVNFTADLKDLQEFTVDVAE